MASFTTALSNVRRLTSSNLSHQSKPAQLLVAIEQTISSQLSSSSSSTPTLPHSATAYFASLLQCLEKAVAEEVPGGEDEAMAESENMGQGALIPALLYLLAIVVPETSTQVVMSKVSPLLENCLPLFDSALEHPPALRSLLQITTSIITCAPAALLTSSPLLKKAWNYLLELNLDPRPKVRHVAQEGVRKVLTTPIPPKITAGSHPYLPRAREWTMRILQDEANGSGAAQGKKKARFDADEQEGKKAIWVVQGLRGWVAVWGDEVSQCVDRADVATIQPVFIAAVPTANLAPDIANIRPSRSFTYSTTCGRCFRRSVCPGQSPYHPRLAPRFPSRLKVERRRRPGVPLRHYVRTDQAISARRLVCPDIPHQGVRLHLQQCSPQSRGITRRVDRCVRCDRLGRYCAILHIRRDDHCRCQLPSLWIWATGREEKDQDAVFDQIA